MAILVIFLLIESSIYLLLHKPNILAGYPLKLYKKYYTDSARKIIQYLPECAIFDSELAYTLKPGICSFLNPEFDTTFKVNSLGFRGSEKDMESPEVIILGDSYAMGWGVEQQETFADIIQTRTGLKVLNTAVSSYGTAREAKTLRRVKTDRLKYLIVQYSGNDVIENMEFYKSKNQLNTMSREKYNEVAILHQKSREYFFGKNLFEFLKIITQDLKSGHSTKTKHEEDLESQSVEADLFVNALATLNPLLNNVQIIVFELDSPFYTDGVFAKTLQRRLQANLYAGMLDGEKIKVLNLSPGLKKDHFFILDDHLNANGHRYVADKLLSHIPL